MRNVIVVSMLVLAMYLPASANLLTNGGFELDPASGATYPEYTYVSSGWSTDHDTNGDGVMDTTTAIWHCYTGFVEPYGTPGWSAPTEGSRAVAFKGDLTILGGISYYQIIDVVAGQEYDASVTTFSRFSGNWTRLRILDGAGIAGSLIDGQTYTSDGDPDNKEALAINFIAPSNQITFALYGRYDYSWFDDASLKAVPEPATMMLLGLGGLLLGLRRKK